MNMRDKVRTGVFGLNAIMDGGLNRQSTTVVIGASGAGKTTMALQFIRRGLEMGQEGVFLTLDEDKNQIVREAESMGMRHIEDYIQDGKLVFIDASAKEFTGFVKSELPLLVEEWRGFDARIVVDPLTPVMWTIDDPYVQREYVSLLMSQLRAVGTVLCTLEEHGGHGDLSGSETTIPMYVADCVIHLRHNLLSRKTDRTLKILKFRGSRHDGAAHPYKIIKGLGIVVHHDTRLGKAERTIPGKLKAKIQRDLERLPEEISERILSVLDELHDHDLEGIDPDQFIRSVLEEYARKDK